jgi:hypothetical protein
MAKSSSTERMRRFRKRQGDGIVLTPQYHVTRDGIALLVTNGWLEPGAPVDSKTVGEAIRRLINETLGPSPREPKQPLRDMMRRVTCWMF